MAKKSVLHPPDRTVRPQPRLQHPRLPHPSWRQAVAGEQAETRTMSVDDFWRRIGL